MKKLLLSGNEAIALGAYEAGVLVGTGYPGTPSTEILETLKNYKDVYTEWSVNEKVAYEVALGSAISGARSLVTMKHVGVNVAADPLFTSVYTGIKAGFVLVSCDDPGMHSSQNEQDNRLYSVFAKIPMLEPSDSQEAKDFTKLAFEISEKFDTPVMLRSTTRISHAKAVVQTSEERAFKTPEGFKREFTKYVMIPGHARLRHEIVEKRLMALKKFSESTKINNIEFNDKKTGYITSGITYNYLKEVFLKASILKLGMPYPFPDKLIKEFAKKVKRLIIVEELEPFIETHVKSLGIKCEGKKYFSNIGELGPDKIKSAFGPAKKYYRAAFPGYVPPRYPVLCPGCPHRNVFEILNKLKFTVSGDIGCYSLGVLPPFSALDTCIDMGASITAAQGIEIAGKNNTVAVIGDSTFAHSGITGLINAAYNKRNSLIIVLDNGTTAMTGLQPNPFSGKTIKNEDTFVLDYKKLSESVGIGENNFMEVNAFKKDDVENAILTLKATGKLSLLVIKGKCIILARKQK
jgi:indolepyruvate ferredoxin oxidoreductase alpha subunit